jgi:hypothetical protein
VTEKAAVRAHTASHTQAQLRDMGEGCFNPWRDASERACVTCRYSIGRSDGFHLWCERHKLVTVFPCGWWEREAGADHDRAGSVRDQAALPSASGAALPCRINGGEAIVS